MLICAQPTVPGRALVGDQHRQDLGLAVCSAATRRDARGVAGWLATDHAAVASAPIATSAERTGPLPPTSGAASSVRPGSAGILRRRRHRLAARRSASCGRAGCLSHSLPPCGQTRLLAYHEPRAGASMDRIRPPAMLPSGRSQIARRDCYGRRAIQADEADLTQGVALDDIPDGGMVGGHGR